MNEGFNQSMAQLRIEIVSGLNSVERTNSKEAEKGGGRISEKREKGAMITLI